MLALSMFTERKMKIIEKIVNVQTGEEKIIEREETEQEKLYRQELENKANLAKQALAVENAKRSAALAKLEALGLDEDDLKALGL